MIVLSTSRLTATARAKPASLPGTRTSAKSHPYFGRKQQDRSYDNYYDLARALVGWVEAKRMRHAEKETANEIYENPAVQAALNGLCGKLYFKIHNLEAEGLVDHARHQDILLELRSGLSIAKGGYNDRHQWVRDDALGQRTRLGHYQRYHRKIGQDSGDARVGHGVPEDQLEILRNPYGYALKDKVIILHDLMEYFGTHQSWNPVTAGENLLPVETRNETMVTTAVDAAGTRTASVSMSDGTPAEKRRARGMGLTTGSRDEDAANTLLARRLKLPVWAGQSMTTVRMMKLAQWVGASSFENAALAMSIFAYWRKDYDHRSDFAYHTMFEVLDVAKNFGVNYRMRPSEHEHDAMGIQGLLDESRRKYDGLLQVTRDLAGRVNRLGVQGELRVRIAQLFQELKQMDGQVNEAYRIASSTDAADNDRSLNLSIVVVVLENAVQKQKEIRGIVDAIPIPSAGL